MARRLRDARGDDKGIFWLKRTNSYVKAEPTIRDVCQKCNNGYLSELDDYVCTLFDKYFVKILCRHESVDFEFDYHRLKRWLIKLVFNSARVHKSPDLFVFAPLIPYISGQSPSSGRSVQLFVQLSYPGIVPADRLNEDAHDRVIVWQPEMHRLGHAIFQDEQGQKILRAIHLRSYTFYLAFFDSIGASSEKTLFSKSFMSTMSGVTMLVASQQKVSLVCDGIDAWSSYDGSTGNHSIE